MGASVLWSALKYVLVSIENRQRELGAANDVNIVLLSDGEWATPSDVLKLLRDHCSREGNRTRMFTVGFGDGPHRHNLTALARVGGGSMEIAKPGQVYGPIAKQLERCEQVALSSIEVQWLPEEISVQQSPPQLHTLFNGEHTLVRSKLHGRRS